MVYTLVLVCYIILRDCLYVIMTSLALVVIAVITVSVVILVTVVTTIVLFRFLFSPVLCRLQSACTFLHSCTMVRKVRKAQLPPSQRPQGADEENWRAWDFSGSIGFVEVFWVFRVC